MDSARVSLCCLSINTENKLDVLVVLGLVFLSTIIIVKACDGFEVAADYLGRHLSEGVKGASINAIGSSMPEIFATFVFLFIFDETSGFAGGIGTTAGSAVFNAMFIPAVSALTAIKICKIAAIKVSKKVLLRDGLMLILAEFVLIIIIGNTLQWWHGMLLMSLYVGYATYMLMSMKKTSHQTKPSVTEITYNTQSPSRFVALIKLDLKNAIIGNNPIQTHNSWLLLTASTLIMAIACYILVYACELFGYALGIQGYFVAIILVAVASSVPDTILSVKDAKKGNYDDAIANALGSNIFDICFALGLPLFLYTLINGPINMPKEMVEHISELLILLLILTISTCLVFYLGKKINRHKAFTLLTLYATFTVYIIARAYDAGWIQVFTDSLHSIQRHLQ